MTKALLVSVPCPADPLIPHYAPHCPLSGIAFSGYVDPNQALAASAAIKNSLPGQKFLSLGGGNALGSWSRFALQSITEAIKAGSFSGYQVRLLDYLPDC